MEMTRTFPGLFSKSRGKKRFPPPSLMPAKKCKPLQVSFYLLPKEFERTPTDLDKVSHLEAGLGSRTACLDESITHEELCDALIQLYPKLQTITGGWLLYKSTAGWGIRKLSLVSPDDAGYTGRILKSVAQGGQKLYIVPIQEDIGTSPLKLTNEAFKDMAKAKCQKCGVDVPLQLLQDHINSCAVIEIDFDPTDEDPSHPDEEKLQPCPVCLKIFPTELIERHASSCGESSVSPQSAIAPNEEFAAIPGPSKVSTVYEEWLSAKDPGRVILETAQHHLQSHENEKPLTLSMDIRKSPTEQDMALISFYKQTNVAWARPLK
ncbi:unnamed protein product [Knipowitschia caucasica]